MQVQFSRWGNSLAIRIPAPFAKEIGAVDGGAAEMRVEQGHIVIVPNPVASPTLDDLVGGITDDNRHSEADFALSVGNEAW
ncbi:MAG: AbrB/MazE/SpoVT family DNA-binding domain-containing protein [Magnetospirillum sp.]|nr:AbrB/MazE/SpoVT family DNA-binding domain-containing protein [Magnetospirillum sp.]